MASAQKREKKKITKKGWALRIGLGLLALLLIIIVDVVVRLWFVDAKPVPPTNEKFITASPVNLDQIIGISKYRSCQGHDFASKGYEGIVESNRSMKHYLVPQEDLTKQLGVIEMRSPVDGRVVYTMNESAGDQLTIEPTGHEDYSIILFHIDPLPGIGNNTKVTAGQLLGYANVKGRHDFDIALSYTRGQLLVERISRLITGSPNMPLPRNDYYLPPFDYATDNVIAEFSEAGFDMKNLQYTREFRDQNSCDFDTAHQYEDDWIYKPGTRPQFGPGPDDHPPADFAPPQPGQSGQPMPMN